MSAFGFCDALQIRLQLLSPSTPYQILQMIRICVPVCYLHFSAFENDERSGTAKELEQARIYQGERNE